VVGTHSRYARQRVPANIAIVYRRQALFEVHARMSPSNDRAVAITVVVAASTTSRYRVADAVPDDVCIRQGNARSGTAVVVVLDAGHSHSSTGGGVTAVAAYVHSGGGAPFDAAVADAEATAVDANDAPSASRGDSYPLQHGRRGTTTTVVGTAGRSAVDRPSVGSVVLLQKVQVRKRAKEAKIDGEKKKEKQVAPKRPNQR